MSILVLAEHDGSALAPSTLNTLGAAKEIGGDIHLLVAGDSVGAIAEAAAKVEGVAKVIKVEDAAYGHSVAEALAPLLVKMAGDYSHVLAPATTFGKSSQ